MTIIASFELNGFPIIIGDALISAPREHAEEFGNISIPTFTHPNRIIKGGAENQIVGMRQKIEIISDQICLAWAGSWFEAYSFIRYLVSSCRNKILTWEEFKHAVDIFGLENSRNFQFVAYFWTGSNIGSVDNSGNYNLGELSQVRLFGSGAESLFPTLEALSEQSARHKTEGDQFLRGLLIGSTFVGYAVSSQVFVGNGINEYWGGAFEIAYFDSGTKNFQKADRTLQVFLDCLIGASGIVKLKLLRPFLYQYYSGTHLISILDTGDAGSSSNSKNPSRVHLTASSVRESEVKMPDTLPTDFPAAIAIFSVRVRRNESINIAVKSWAGEFSNCPIKIWKEGGGNYVQVSKTFIQSIIHLISPTITEYEFNIEP